jgi:hypothetical protein
MRPLVRRPQQVCAAVDGVLSQLVKGESEIIDGAGYR